MTGRSEERHAAARATLEPARVPARGVPSRGGGAQVDGERRAPGTMTGAYRGEGRSGLGQAVLIQHE